MKKRETAKERRERVARGRRALSVLKKLFPDKTILLNHRNHWELLVAVILSAQCTDKKVNEVTTNLFKKYPTLHDYTLARAHEFERDIYATGFYRSKTKNILAAAKMIEKSFHGTLPKTMAEMLHIPGVGRKTANVVLAQAFGLSEGIAVDTHVKRLARVFGLSDEESVDCIEKDLMDVFRRKDWMAVNHLMVLYGRKYCPARRHNHSLCPLGHYEKQRK